MRLIDESGVEQADLLPLLQFVIAYAPHHKKVVVYVENANKSANTAKGWAGLTEGRVIVKLILRRKEDFTYTYRTREVSTVPYMYVSTWEEEVVLVAAHEMRHAGQFLSGTFSQKERLEAEADAERFASKVLDAYRTFRGYAITY